MKEGVKKSISLILVLTLLVQLLPVVSFRKIWGPVAGVFGLVGILVGVGGSLTAIRKFLRV